MTVTGSSFRNSYMKIGHPAGAAERQLGVHRQLAPGLRRGADGSEEPLRVLERAEGHAGAPTSRRPGGLSRTTCGAPIRSASTSTRSRGSGNPKLFNNFFTFDFDTVRAASLPACVARTASSQLAGLHDRSSRRGRIAERLRAVQPAFDTGACRCRCAVGLRYEQTDVTSSALVPTPTGIIWASETS